MPDPDAVIETRAIASKAITSDLLDDDVSTGSFTATDTLRGVKIRTDTTGDYLLLVNGNILLFTGDALESLNGLFRVISSGSGDSATLQVELSAPNWNASGQSTLVVRSESNDDSASPPGWIFVYTGDSSQTAEVVLQAVDLRVQGVGKATIEGELVIPAVTSDPSSPADGNMWLHTADNALYIWEGGAKRTVASW